LESGNRRGRLVDDQGGEFMMSFSFREQGVALRAFEPEDAPSLRDYLNHPSLSGRRYLPDGFSDFAPLSARQVETVIERWQKETGSWTLAVTEAASGAVVGHARADWEWDSHCPSATVVISPEHQRRGAGAAALAVALAFLFEETPAHAVSGWIASWNEPALAFALSSGFREAGRRPRGGLHAGAFYSEVALDLLRPEWSERRAKHAS
jgi:RimJ/RimL family protein N-acetyltransferase